MSNPDFLQPTKAQMLPHPEPPPREAPSAMLAMIIACLLKERAAESDLRTAVAALAAERHRHFHLDRKNPEEDWLKCTNPVCCQYGRLLQRLAEPEATISSFALQASQHVRVMFDVKPGSVRVFIADQPRIAQPAKSRIIIP